MGLLASRPPALTRFRSRAALSLVSLAPGLKVAPGREPMPSYAPPPPPPPPPPTTLTAALRPRLISTYAWALRLRGKAGMAAGISAPFCQSSSATGNGTTLSGASVRDGVEVGDGDAGSAAARARNMACVPRDLSVELGLAPRARPYITCWISFFLMAASSVSSAVGYRDSVVEMGSTYAFSTYLAVMNFSLCSRVAWGVGCLAGSSLASNTMLETLLPTRRSNSTMSAVNDVMSNVSDRTLLMWVPRDLWIPLLSMQRMMARLIDTHSTLVPDPQSAHQQLPWSLSRSICSNMSGCSSKLLLLVRCEPGRAPTVIRRVGRPPAAPALWPWPWLIDELLPVRIEPISRRKEEEPASCDMGCAGLSFTPLPSTALCKALLIDVIQLFMSSSEVAWYTRLKCGVMTSKQKRRSAFLASLTEAIRRSMGSMWRSSFCFQLLYSESLPWSRTIQNLEKRYGQDDSGMGGEGMYNIYM